MTTAGRRWTAIVLAGGCLLSFPGARSAQAAPTDLSVPMFTTTGDPYGLTVAPAQSGPAGTVAVTQTAPPLGYGFEEFKDNIHGYVSAGVGTHGGRGVEGGVLLPLVPGKAELEIGGGTSRIGDFYSLGPHPKRLAVDVTDYHATLHLHPTDDTDITLTYAGANFSQPRPVGH